MSLAPEGWMQLQVEHDIGEGRYRDIGRCDPLVDGPLQHTEVSERREQPLGDPASRFLGPLAAGFTLSNPAIK